MTSGLFRQSLAATIALVGLSFASTGALAQGNEASMVEIHGGTATFDAATNVAVISIHGKSTALEGRARIRQSADGLVIEQLEAALPVRTLSTGMGLRDEHMRKYVFTTPDGLLPDMRFVAERAVCSGTGAAKTCLLSGDMLIRDTSSPVRHHRETERSGRLVSRHGRRGREAERVWNPASDRSSASRPPTM